MKVKKGLLAFVFILTCSIGQAKEVTDTLWSATKDRVIVTYNIFQNDTQTILQFLHSRKVLGKANSEKYKNLDEVAILFFDRIGNYEDDMRFSGINVNAFMVPSEVSYESSEDGYFLLKDEPRLSFNLKSSETVELEIPLFLAHYERKHRYRVFSRCENLRIRLSKNKFTNRQNLSNRQLVTQTITAQEDIEGTDADAAVANSLINRINVLLTEQEEYPFSDELKQAISSLREISYRPIDSKLSSRISDVLSACNQREKELKAAAKAMEESVVRNAEHQAKLAEEQARARQDSIATAAQQKAEEDRKQNLWLIIGGVVLAVLAFVGNQTFQHFRNAKNQRNMMNMQEDLVKRAEDEAKRRARNMARSQINRAQIEAKRKTRSAINDGIGKMGKKGKGNKGISI